MIRRADMEKSIEAIPSCVGNDFLEEAGLQNRGKYHLKRSASRTLAYLGRKGPQLVEWSILNNLRAMGFDLEVSRDNKSVYEPEKLVQALARYGKKPDLSLCHPDILQRAKDLTFRVFGRQTTFRPLPLDSELERFVQREKSSGLPDLARKGDTFLVDLERATRIASGSRAPDPCVAFHRVQHGNEGPKTRLVWGYPQSMFLLEARFAPTLIEFFLERETPMAFGLYKSQVSARMQSIRNSGLRYSLDFSGFDSSIDASLLAFAFDVLASHFDMDDEESYTWEKIVNYFIHTPLMMPDQCVWVKHHGVPSGSYFTQMIDTIVNYLSVMYAWLRATDQPIPDDKILVLGDDSIVGQSKYVSLTDLQTYFTEIGLTLNVQKTGLSKQGEDDPHFLGHVWRRGYPDRDPREIAMRMAFPEKPSGIKDNGLRRAIRILSYIPDAVSAHEIALGLAPERLPHITSSHLSHLVDKEGIKRVPPELRPGWAAFLEELGTADPWSSTGLALRGPVTGLYY